MCHDDNGKMTRQKVASDLANEHSVSMLSLFLINYSGYANPVTQFIENKGQWHDDVLFKASIPGGDLYVLKNKLKYVLLIEILYNKIPNCLSNKK